ncbi:MAG: gliding motility-associated peptidyl-prolyl isomerase GldI [Bacteroidetes bacterium]|nr:MAG: gliding motility-associated peptidyl-prolyl isomerase GldI [Bacteroidota bacterium]
MKVFFKIIIVLLLIVSCKSPEARRPETQKTGSFIKESVERNKKLLELQQNQIEEIIKNNPENNYIASQNGFWYYYNSQIEGDSITPKFGDIVNFNYNIKDLNSNVIYSSEELKTQNYAMDQEELFTGLREGLKLMKAGEVVTFLFPSQQAYGYYGDEKKIGTNISLICKVTVNSITQKIND